LPRAKLFCDGQYFPDRGSRCPGRVVRALAFLVLRGLGQPDTASGAAIGSQLGNIAIARRDARQPQRPRADRACRLQRVVITDRSHQVSESQHGNLVLFFRHPCHARAGSLVGTFTTGTFKRPGEIQTHVLGGSKEIRSRFLFVMKQLSPMCDGNRARFCHVRAAACRPVSTPEG